MSIYDADISSLVLHRQVAPYVLGSDLFDIDGPGRGIEISPRWLEGAHYQIIEAVEPVRCMRLTAPRLIIRGTADFAPARIRGVFHSVAEATAHPVRYAIRSRAHA